MNIASSYSITMQNGKFILSPVTQTVDSAAIINHLAAVTNEIKQLKSMVAQIAHSLRHVHQTLNIKIDIANRGINELKATTRRLQENTRDRPTVEGAADACT